MMNDRLIACFMRVHSTSEIRKICQFLPDSRLTNPVGFDITTIVQQDSPYDAALAEVLYYGGVI